jgi:hypothetical protein
VPELAAIFGVTRESIRSWIHRFNAAGPSGLCDEAHGRHSMPPRKRSSSLC